MINSTFNQWTAAFICAILGHVALAFAWTGPAKPMMEKSAGTPITIVGSLSTFADSKPMEEIVEETELAEEVPEEIIEPIESVMKPLDEPVVEQKQALLLAKAVITSEKPTIIKPEPPKKVKKKTKKKKKKARKKPPRKKSIASKKMASIRKGAGARGKRKNRAGSATRANYRGRVLSHLARYKRKPGGGNLGRATVSFSISKSGSVTSVRISRRSGNAAVDRATLATIRRASPFPPIPSGMNNRMKFTVRINYNSR